MITVRGGLHTRTHGVGLELGCGLGFKNGKYERVMRGEGARAANGVDGVQAESRFRREFDFVHVFFLSGTLVSDQR